MNEIDSLRIAPERSVRIALERMDREGRKILFVLRRGGVLAGVVTDGDLRRWILKGGALEEPIHKAMQREPVTLNKGHSSVEARELLLRHGIDCAPVIDERRRLTGAVWWMDLFGRGRTGHGKKENIPTVVMAGGEGHRLGPLTKILPKPLVPIGEKPIIEMIIERFSSAGTKDFYLTLGYKSKIVKAYFQETRSSPNRRIHCVEEKQALGTAGGLVLLKRRLVSTFWVSNCDILIDTDLSAILRSHRHQKNAITLVGCLKRFTIPYGVCLTREDGSLNGINEKPGYDLVVSTGVYLLEPSVIDLIPAQKTFHFTDLINRALRKRMKVGVFPISERAWMDMGQVDELKAMSRRFGVEL